MEQQDKFLSQDSAEVAQIDPFLGFRAGGASVQRGPCVRNRPNQWVTRDTVAGGLAASGHCASHVNKVCLDSWKAAEWEK